MTRAIRRLAATTAAVALLAVSATAAAAHTHTIGSNGQVLANGQNHPAFNPVTFESCVTNTLLPGFGPAWYGLETAHHGPDSGAAGKGDGCYKADASPLSEADDVNPAID
jgi:hypothetical protein